MCFNPIFFYFQDYAAKYKSQIDKAIKYVADKVSTEEDVYALAIAAVVLKKIKHSEAGKLLEKLDKSSKFENDLKWWSNMAKDHSNDIEVTSYILQSLVDSEEPGKLLPIIKWLVSQRNSLGGFDSTQDTVVGLQALIKFAEKYSATGDGKMKIEFEAQDGEGKDVTKGTFSVDKENSLLLQTHVVSRKKSKSPKKNTKSKKSPNLMFCLVLSRPAVRCLFPFFMFILLSSAKTFVFYIFGDFVLGILILGIMLHSRKKFVIW